MTRTADPEVLADGPDERRGAVEPELLEVFLQEAEGHLQAIRSLLPTLEAGGPDAVQTVRRAAHTLKGSAAMVGFHALTRLAHRMEDLLDRMYAGLPSTPDIIDLLNASANRLEDLAAGQEDADVLQDLYARYDRLLGQVEAAAPAKAARRTDSGETPTVESSVRVPLRRLDELVRLVSDLTVARAAFEQRMNTCLQYVEELQRRLARLSAGARRECSGDADEGAARDVAEAADVGQELARLSGDADDLLGRQSRIAGALHDGLMRVRLVPFGNLAARLRRTVRQVAERSGKPVDLELGGESVELDKAVLEEMAEPLMHLLRNAVDHGVDPPERRRERGKREGGRITVRAAQEGDQVVLRVADDGGGVDAEAVRRRAVERGFAAAETAAAMTEAELFGLVFQPGFSTAREISETSGRGVGLDVVRAVVERLKGSVTLTSRPGEGTTFVIRLPMTVAVTRALLVRAGGQTFALPQSCVARVARLGTEAADTERGSIRIDEDIYPRVVLAEALRLRTPPTEETGRPSVLVVETGEGRAAVIVDEVQGGREVVVKNLGTHLRKVHGVSGATLTGDGAVVLILNPLEFTKPPPQSPSRRPTLSAVRPPSVLLVDDSASVRLALENLVRGAGWSARAACDGVEALELLAAGAPPDVMLVDVDMPRMDGFEFLSAVKAQSVYRGVPVVMLTSRTAAADRRRAEELGADAYVVKPFRDEELLATVRRLTAAGC